MRKTQLKDWVLMFKNEWDLAILCFDYKSICFLYIFTFLWSSYTAPIEIAKRRLKAEKVKKYNFSSRKSTQKTKWRVTICCRFRFMVDFPLKESLSSCSAISLDKYWPCHTEMCVNKCFQPMLLIIFDLKCRCWDSILLYSVV